MTSAKECAIKLTLAAGLAGLASYGTAVPITGWSGVGNYGTAGADGDVTLSPFPGSDQYAWVSTDNGAHDVGLPNVGGAGNPTNGSSLTSTLFSAEEDDELNFFFNYVTSDGAGFADYAWARLLHEDETEAALLFTARTTEDDDTVPGFSMPEPIAALNPENTPIVGGAPNWSPLGASSGSCYDTGCGYTDWVQASYEIEASGNYYLEFGVVNWNDTAYQSGLAFDGATIGGVVIGDPVASVPEPASLALLGLGLAGLGAARRRFRA